MATLVLQAAGAAVGGLLGPVGAVLGRAAGALAGHAIDQSLFSESKTRTVGRMEDLSVQTSAEGNAIPRVHGRMRIAGTVIWARDFDEHVSTSRSGGKGGGPKVREYSYTANFAVALCEGPIARVGRVWADGELVDLTTITMRTHLGTEEQAADPLIEALEDVAPAYRGTAYVVFENLPVGPYGNRLPQLTFEVLRPVGELEGLVRAVTLIPGATEFGYHPEEVTRVVGPGEAAAENRHLPVAASDFEASLDELLAVCPNLSRIALVVSWFGSDLRAGHCLVEPRVEAAGRETTVAWQVAGLERETARLVSQTPEGRPYYGGTPADAAVVAAIAAIRARGLAVVFYPFLLMDIAPGNGLPDPYGGSEQAPFPWRGRITVAPDGDAAADAAIATFVGTAAVGDFSVEGTAVAYAGPEEWTLRRMVLHYAHLCAAAGGVDAFLVGSELRGLTTVRGASGYPFVAALCQLADDVRDVLGPGVKISYAADWSEYFGHHADGDVTFHLDPFWARPSVDFVGIDNYWPLSDWRDGDHLDLAVAGSVHDHAYLSGNVAGGEGYDWYYASAADRAAQARTPITDGAAGKPWVFRYKDLAAWWSNLHHDRVGGVELGQPTAWIPGMKPVWFTEVGCPAVDRGANQPNVFVDPKSAESALPYFSRGHRDDAMQRAYLTAMLSAFDPARSHDIERINPASGIYAGRMVDPATVHVWTWDARPWPVFPGLTDVWADGENWERGHWVNGRLGAAPFGELVAALFADWELAPPVVEGVTASLDGHLVASPTSLREVVEPILSAVSAVGADTGTAIRFVGLDRPAVALLGRDDLVETNATAPLVSETRAEAATLPVEVRLRHHDSGRDFQVASARYRRPDGSARQVQEIQVSAALSEALATQLADVALGVAWGGRTVVRFTLPPSRIALLPGDIVTLGEGGRERDLLVEEVEDLGRLEVTARTIDRQALLPAPAPAPPPGSGSPSPGVQPAAPPVAPALDLPILSDVVAEHVPFIAVFARPWPGEMGVWRAPAGGTFQLVRTLTRAASVGVLLSPLPPGPTSRWDEGSRADLLLYTGQLASAGAADVLAGGNSLAVQAANGVWEVLQFRSAMLIGERTYRLSSLLRGQLGTEDAAAAGANGGAAVVLLDGNLAELPTPRDAIGLERTLRIGPLAEGIGGRNVTTFAFTPRGRGLSPYSPVHGAVRLRPSDGALLVRWIRRTRVGGDPWPDATDVPLGETAELYRLEILNGASAVRTVETATPSYTYALGDQVADLGGSPTTLSFRVAQIAPGYGPGVPHEVTVDVEQP